MIEIVDLSICPAFKPHIGDIVNKAHRALGFMNERKFDDRKCVTYLAQLLSRPLGSSTCETAVPRAKSIQDGSADDSSAEPQ